MPRRKVPFGGVHVLDGRELRQRDVRWPVDTEARFLACYDATVVGIHGYASRLTGDQARAEDLVQDVYVQLLRHARAGTVTEATAEWLRVAVRHRFLDSIRSADREGRRLRLVTTAVPDARIDGADEGSALDGTSLSDRERAALTLRYIDDLPVAEVAKAIGSSVRATESLLARARARARSEVRGA